MNDGPILILASTSRRRFDLMNGAKLRFVVVPPEVEEFHDESVPLAELTRHNASLKAEWVAALHSESWVIGADTLVSIDNEAMGKPADLTEARAMLNRLSGRTHVVGTAVCLIHAASGQKREFLEETRVTFKPLDDAGIRHYLTLINPLDKAGAYAAQEHGEVILAKVEGAWSNVVGLPVERLIEELKEIGVIG